MEGCPLTFKPIRLPADADTCVRFTTDAFVCSFGDASRFATGSHHYLKPEEYLEWLRAKLAKAPESAVHVWDGDEIIGQVELGIDRRDPEVGYIHLYYLVPNMRGKGFAGQLDDYACDYLQRMGHSKAKLSVTRTNGRALRFYEKLGWREVGESQDDLDVVIMEKALK